MKGNGQKQLDSSFTVILIIDFCRKAQPSLSLLKTSDLGVALMKPTHKEESPKNFHRLNLHTPPFSEGILEQQAPSFSGIHLFSSDRHGGAQKKSPSLILKGLNSHNEAQNSQGFQDSWFGNI